MGLGCRGKCKLLLGATGIGVVSWLGGVLYEQRRKEGVGGRGLRALPALPAFATVSAAAPFHQETTPTDTDLDLHNHNRTTQIMKYGFPSLDNVRSFDDFVLSYDRRVRIANWVFEHLTAERLKVSDNVDRAKCDFTEDNSIHPYFRSTNKDYKGSGFDRGHLAAAGNHRLEQRHCDQTFLLTNISPQVGVGFNRDSWNKLEKHVRKLTKLYTNVYVCTGPLFLPKKESDGKTYVKYQVIGENHVAVPTHFFKVVVMESTSGHLSMEAYVMPNQAIPDGVPLTSFMVPPESVERSAGLLFFDRLSRTKLTHVNGKKTTYV